MRICTLILCLAFSGIAVAHAQPGLEAGAKAPDFEAINYEGETVRLSQVYKDGPVVLVFYRGGWCPFCNIQLKSLQAKLDEFTKHNASLIAISVDKPVKAAETVKSLSLGFDVISDRQTDILRSYNLTYKVPDELNQKYINKHGIDLEDASGRTDHVIAVPATYIIDTSGEIVFAYANEDYKVRTSPEEILRELEQIDKSPTEIMFSPIEHASFVIQTEQASIYIDPVGEEAVYDGITKPDFILITDIHRDHFDADVIRFLSKENTAIIGPKAVIDKLGFGDVLNNGQSKTYPGLTVEAIPMYNLTPNRLKYHQKGRGNGYVLTLMDKRIYVSGDTEDIYEMRRLKDIDYAFVCMNLPYTMTPERAASAVADFKPKVVFPYHYRGKGGMSDIQEFKETVSQNPDIEVRFLDWYR